MHGQLEPRLRPHLAGQRKEAKPQDNQSNAKPETRRAEGRGELPRQDPCRGRPPQPRQEPCRGNLPNTSKAATLEPKGSNTINHVGTKAREAPPWWHADLCDDHKQTRSDEDQKTTILGKILAEEIHETPGKILVGDDRSATARPLSGPRQDPCRGRQWGRGLAHVCQDSDTSILHHAFISIFITLRAIITHYVTILMAILSYFTRFT